MANSKYVPNRNVIPDKRKKKEEKKTGYRYDKTGKKITSSDKNSETKKNTSSGKSGEVKKTSPSSANRSSGAPKIITRAEAAKAAMAGNQQEEKPVAPYAPTSKSPKDRAIDYLYKKHGPSDQQIMQGVGNNPNKDYGTKAFHEKTWKGATEFQYDQIARGSNPTQNAQYNYFDDLAKAAGGNKYVLDTKRKEIENLEKQGLTDDWWLGWTGLKKQTNKSKIKEAEDQYQDYKNSLRMFGFDSVNAALNSEDPNAAAAKSIIDKQYNYTSNDMADDLVTIDDALRYGTNKGSEFDAAVERLNAYYGRDVLPYIEENHDPGGMWMNEFLESYDGDRAELDAFVKANSGVSGTDAEISANDMFAYRQAVDNQIEKETKLAEWNVSRDAMHNSFMEDPEYDVFSQYIPRGDWYTSADDSDNGIETWDDASMINDLVNAVHTGEYDKVAEEIRGTQRNDIAAALIDYIRYMSPDDVSDFNYIMNTSGFDEAFKFITEDIMWNLGRQYEDEKATRIQQDIAENPWTAIPYSVTSFGDMLASGIGGVASFINPLTGQELNEYHPLLSWSRSMDTKRGATTAMLENEFENASVAGFHVPSILYNGAMSAADSAINTAIYGHMATPMMAFSAYGSSLYQNLESMGNGAGAYIDAAVDGGIEALTEYFSVEGLLDDAVSSGLKTFGKQLITEPSEEVFGELLRFGYDTARYGENSEVNRQINDLIAQGYSESEAEAIAARDFARKLGETIFTSAISGAAGGARGAVQQGVANYQTGKQLREYGDDDYQVLIDIGKTVPLSKSQQRIMETLDAEIAARKAQQTAEEQEQEAPKPEINPAERLNDMKPQERELEEEAEPINPAERLNQMKPQEREAEAEAEPINPAERLNQMKPQKREAEEITEQEAPEAVEEQAEDIAEEIKENPEANADKAADKMTKAAKGKGGKKVTKAQLGMLYRSIAAKLDEKAQDALRERVSFNVAKELRQKGVKGEEAKSLATSMLRIQDGNFTEEDFEAVQNNPAARSVLAEWTKKVDADNEAQMQLARIRALMPSRPMAASGSTKTNEKDAIEANDDFAVKAAEVEEKAKGMQMSEGEDSTIDGEAVKILGAAPAGTADGGNVAMIRVVTPDGEERIVDADSIAYSEADSAVYDLAQYATSYGANADIMYGAYQAGQDVGAYAAAFDLAARHGSDGRNINTLMHSGVANVLTESQIKTAYELGRGMRAQRGQQAQAERSKKGAGVKTGRVDTSAIKNNVLTKHQRATIRAMEGLAEVLDMNVRFVASKADAKGRYTTENGSWDANTRMLTVDIHAGSNLRNDVRYSMMDTVGHELTHYIRQLADNDLWNEYQDFIMSHLESKMDLGREIKRKMAANEDLTRDDAIEEIIADASSQALSRITEAQINELAQSNPTLFKKIASFIKKWVSGIRRKIRNAFETEAAEANRFAKAMEDSLDEMAAMWNRMLVNANRNAQGMQSAAEAIHMSVTTQQAIENDQAVDAEAELKHSIREDERFGEDARRVNQTNGFVSKAALEQALKDRKTIRDIFLDPDNRDLLKLPPDIMGDTFVSDASYGGTEENTTVCIRSMAAQALMDLISQNLGRPLTVQDTLLISQEIAGLTDRPECYYCYVATDRRAYRDFLGQYLEQRNAVIEKYKAGADKAALYTEFLGGRKPTANMKARFNMWLNAVDNGTALIDGNDLASLENLFAEVDSLRNEIIAEAANVSGVDAGKLNIVNSVVKYTKAGKQITATTLNALMKSNPGMAESINRYMQLTDATAYAQSASWAKKMKGYAAYNGHILNWSQKRVNDLNKHYGLRMYSFSDFSPAFILENMQMVTDAAVRGLNMLGYTKEMDFAEIFAPSGMNINISTFAYEQGGEVMEDYKQGASWERAKALRDKHPNVGIVMVATSDNILEWALQQDWVDVVIPYHLVRTGTDVAEYFGYKNYTGVSADGKGLTFAEKNKGKSKKERVTSVSPVEHRNDLISYVDALERYGLTPRFAQWLTGLEDYRAGKISPMQFRAMNPNYMKLVNETRRSYADTDPVQPKFNMEAAQESIQQMIREGGYYTPVGGTMEAEFEIAGTIADKIRGTEADVKRSARENNDDTRYSIRETTDGRKVVAVEDDILQGIYVSGRWTNEQKQKAKAAAKKALANAEVTVTGGIPIYINSKTRTEFPASNYVFDTLGKNRQKLADRFRISSEAQDMLVATVGWEKDTNYKDRTDFVRFVKGSVYMDIHGRKYEGVVKVGVTAAGDHILYDMVDMQQAFFELKKEAISPATQAKNAIATYLEMTSNDGTITHDGEKVNTEGDIKRQMRDPYAVSDREMLVNALENANLSVEDRNRLNGYKKKMSELDEKQKLLEQTTDRINMLEATDEDGNRDEIIRLKNAAQIYAQQIERADEVLLKIEAMAPIKRLADRQRAAYIESVKSGYDERLQKYKQKQKEKIDERIAKIKEREAGKRKDMRKEMNRLKKVAEPNLKERYRNKILSDVKKLYSWVATPTNKAHVPEFLKAPLGEFIQSIDFSSADYLKNAKAGIKDVSMAEALEKLRRVLANVHNQKNIEEGAQEQFGYMDLPAQYLEQLDYFVGEVKKALQNAGTVTDTPLMLLNSDQLAYLSEAIAILKHSVEKMNENFNKSQFESPRSTANATIEDMYKLKAKVKTNKTLETINSMYNWKNTTPYYAFQRMGKGGKAIFEALQDGWDKMAQNSSILIEYAEEAFTSKQAKAWTKDIKTIQLANGDEIKMTASQIMSMYCLNKREQAVGHMLGGGIRIEDINLRAGNTLHDVDNHTLTESDINKILNLLTPEQMSVANKLQEFMNTTCTDWGNEISMKRFGYKMFTEKFYFPIEVDANNLGRSEDKQENKKSMFRLLNMSAMKPLTPKANNALVVRDIFDVFTEHTTDIAKYNALALPILDTIRWFNYTDKSEVMDKEGNRTGQIKARSTQKALEHAYGKNAKDYIRKFMEDLNAEHDGGRNDGVLQKLMGNAKAASVGWNARVYLLQITSLPRAAYAINPKYLLKGLAKIRSLNPVNAIKGTEAQDKIGIMKWKSLGFYNTDIARSTRSMVRRDEGFLSKLRGWGMKPAEWGDNWTSNIIYEAAKAEMKDKHPSLQPGSKAYDAMLNKRVREIVYKTQVVDSTMTRSDFMRSKGMMQMFTAFMSEPTLTVNMLNESIQEIVAKHRTGVSVKESIRSVGGKAMKAAAVFVFTATFSAIVEALFDAIRDDDEYETFMEKFMQGLFGEKASDADGAWGKFKAVFDGNIGDNVNIFAMLPLIKEGVSLLEGYEENSMVTQVAKQFIDVKDSIAAWQEGKRPLYDVIYKGFKTIGSATGVGVQNVSRDGVGLYNTFLADAIGQPKVQTYENTKSDAAAAYYDAITKGDTDKAAWVIERAAINGLDTAEFAEKMTGLVKADYAAGKIDADTATKYLESYAGKNRNDAHWLLKEWDYAGEGNFSKYGDLRTALIDGNKSNAQAAYNELAKHGTNEVDIRKDIAKLYNDGTATNMLSLQLRSNNLYTSEVKLKADGEIHKDDFDAFITAIVNGTGIEREADKLFEKGYTVKQCMTAINGAFGNENDIYRKMEMYNSREAEILMDRILDGYEAIGLDRQDEIEWIEDNWKM